METAAKKTNLNPRLRKKRRRKQDLAKLKDGEIAIQFKKKLNRIKSQLRKNCIYGNSKDVASRILREPKENGLIRNMDKETQQD